MLLHGKRVYLEVIMKKFSKILTVAAASLLGSIALASAADLTVNVSTGSTLNATSGTTSGEKIEVDTR